METAAPTAGSSKRPPASRKRRWVITLIVLLVLTALARWIGIWGGNVREVSAGRAYRSAQLNPRHLRQVMRQYGIKTVINLQGEDHGDKARGEQAICRELGADYRHAKMSAVRLPRPGELKRVINALDEARYPILIHCRAGADRSGLVSALYLALHEKRPVDQAARSELTWTKGHFPVQTAAMDRFFELYQETAGGKDLRTWIETSYPEVYRSAVGLPPRPANAPAPRRSGRPAHLRPVAAH